MNRDRRTVSPPQIFFRTLGIFFFVAALILAIFQPLRVGASFRTVSATRLFVTALPPAAMGIGWLLRPSSVRYKKLYAWSRAGSRRFNWLCGLTIVCVLAAVPSVFARLRFGTTGDFVDRVLYTCADAAALSVWGSASFLIPLALAPENGRFAFDRDRARIFVGTLIAMGLAALFVRRTGFGLTRENAFWGEPTVPLIEIHFAAVFLLIWIVLRLSGEGRFGSDRRADFMIGLAVYLAAAVIWLSTPNREGFFSPPGRAPNFELYPFSDGAFYGHYARALINGMGYKGADIPPRPLYILVLALCHLPFGTSYEAVVFCQTLILALLPVLIFRIGRELHSREAGIAAAALYILREVHAINAAPYAHNVSITKYFFADLPAALAAAFFFWMLIRLAGALRSGTGSNAVRPLFYALMSGGALGLAALIRTQFLFLILIALSVPVFVKDKNPGARAGSFPRRAGIAALILLGLTLTVLPWLIRSRAITGSFVFDHPRTQTGELAASYNLGGFDLTREPGMSDGDYQEKLSAVIRLNLTRYPTRIAAFVADHFLNALIASIRLFPIRPALSEYRELLGGTPFWEMGLTSETPALVVSGFVISCLILAYGIAAAVRRRRFSARLPLIGLVLFHFSTALGRYSAGRYLIPMDWALFVYIGAALASFLFTLRRVSGLNRGKIDSIAEEEPMAKSGWYAGAFAPFLAAAVFFMIGCALPLAAKIFPLTLSDSSREAAAEKLALTETAASRYDYLGGAIAIYPRYYEAGSGEPESAKVGYDAAPEGRLMFLTLAPEGFGTIRLRLDDAPEFFPDNATVWIAGSLNGAVTDAALVLVEADGESALYRASKP